MQCACGEIATRPAQKPAQKYGKFEPGTAALAVNQLTADLARGLSKSGNVLNITIYVPILHQLDRNY